MARQRLDVKDAARALCISTDAYANYLVRARTVVALLFGVVLLVATAAGADATSRLPNTTIQSWVDDDSSTAIDEDGNGTETTRLTYSITNARVAEYRIDSGPWRRAGASPFVGPVLPADGKEHTLYLRARKGARVDPTPATAKLTICPQAGCSTVTNERVHGAFSGSYPWDSAALDDYIAKVGVVPGLYGWFDDWYNNGVRNFDPNHFERIYAKGVTPFFTWQSWDRNADNQTTYDIRTIPRGDHDAYIREWARGAKAWGKPFFLRFNHEMNGDWYPYSPGVNDITAADYVAAWRHVHDIFRAEGATNAKWVWCPDAGRSISSAIYPGDSYVDWICLDTYNWGNTKSWSSWRSLYDAFKPGYDAILSVAPSKPLMIGETGSVESGGDKAAWIRQAYNQDVPTGLPKIKMVVYADEYWPPDDWRVDTSAASLAAYKEVVPKPEWGAKPF